MRLLLIIEFLIVIIFANVLIDTMMMEIIISCVYLAFITVSLVSHPQLLALHAIRLPLELYHPPLVPVSNISTITLPNNAFHATTPA